MGIGFIPLVSFIVSLIFAVTVLDQYFARRKPYQLVWSVGLFMYAIGAGTEFWTETWGFNVTIYRLWYLFGAILVAAYLAQGTVYLLARRKFAHAVMIILLIVSVYSAVNVFTTPVDLSTLTHLSGSVLPESTRALSRYVSYAATVVLLGGAVWSAWMFWRKHILPHRVAANILIALGVLLPAIGGGIMRAIGTYALFYVFELGGAVVIFLGFLRTKEVFGFYRFPLVNGFQRVSRD